MKALLLAAGLGTRLRPITDQVPKCLVPIHGRPLLGYWLDLLLDGGIEHVLINTHYLPHTVQRFVAASGVAGRVTLLPEPQLLGTGGTVLAAWPLWGDEPVLVAHADNLSRFDVRAFIATHAARPPGCMLTMMTFATDDPRSCGIVELDERGVVHAFHEKVPNPPGNRANGAVYVFEPGVLADMAQMGRPVLDLSTEVLPRWLGRMATFHNTDYHRDIGTPHSLAAAHAEFSPRG